jgi:hypothetical protein
MKGISGYQSSKAETSTPIESILISYIGFHLIAIILIYCSYKIPPRKAKAFCFLHKQRTYPYNRILHSLTYRQIIICGKYENYTVFHHIMVCLLL